MTQPYQISDQGTSGPVLGDGSTVTTIGSITIPAVSNGDFAFSLDVKLFGRSDVPASLFADRRVCGSFDGTTAIVADVQSVCSDVGASGYTLSFVGNNNVVEIQLIAPNGVTIDLDWVAWGGVMQ